MKGRLKVRAKPTLLDTRENLFKLRRHNEISKGIIVLGTLGHWDIVVYVSTWFRIFRLKLQKMSLRQMCW